MQSQTKDLRQERITIRLTPSEKANLSALASQLGIKESKVIRSALQQQLELAAAINGKVQTNV